MSVHIALDEEHWASNEFRNLGIKCGRTIKRFIRTIMTLSRKIRSSLARASNNKAEAKAIYRLIDNEQVTEEVILKAHRKATIQTVKESGEPIVLAVQDTTMLNYTSHMKTEGLGDFGGKPRDRGLIVHSSLAVTPQGMNFLSMRWQTSRIF